MSRISAFPTHDADDGTDARERILTGGMYLRDWFAGQALAGRMSIVLDDDGYTYSDASGNDLKTTEGMAASCYAIADAMMRERDKF